PLREIESMRDSRPAATRQDMTASSLASASLDQSLVDFLVPFYEVADSATFFDGTFRTLPLRGLPDHGIPDLAAWNDKGGWKRYEPDKNYDTFYFCSNGFGDLFG